MNVLLLLSENLNQIFWNDNLGRSGLGNQTVQASAIGQLTGDMRTIPTEAIGGTIKTHVPAYIFIQEDILYLY